MNKDVKESVSLVKELKNLFKNEKGVEILVCPPFTSLETVSKELNGSKIRLGAQNMYFEDSGAFTGEVSPAMLKEIGCEYVILGHSERREVFGEDDGLVNKKIISALKHSLKPILCIGETLEQRQSGKTNEVLEIQLAKCLNNISKIQMQSICIAYEPVWAISKGNPNAKAATPEDAENSHKFIRRVVAKMFDEATAKHTMILYGGSMKPENAEELLSLADVNGGLVGNASLNAQSFAEIVKSAK